VFLHGLGVLGPRGLDEPAEAWAARGFRVLAPDLPGFGGSAAVEPEDYRPSRLAQLLLRDLPDSGHNVLLDAADQSIPTVGEWLGRTLG
jgi:alpha-beta hydrolase superfamily lysophospholipase